MITTSEKKVKVVTHTTQRKEKTRLHLRRHRVVVMTKKEQIPHEKGYLVF